MRDVASDREPDADEPAPPRAGGRVDGLGGAVLAGGRSRRMGTDKAWIELGGSPMVAVVVRRLEDVCGGGVVVVAKDPAPFEAAGLTAVADTSSEQTPLAGIARALEQARGPVFVCGCDMPSVSPAVVAELAGHADQAAAVVPLRGGRPETLHAVWTPQARDAVRHALRRGVRAVRDVLEAMPDVVFVEEAEWRRWDPAGTSMRNLNTPDDLGLEIRRRARAAEGP